MGADDGAAISDRAFLVGEELEVAMIGFKGGSDDGWANGNTTSLLMRKRDKTDR